MERIRVVRNSDSFLIAENSGANLDAWLSANVSSFGDESTYTLTRGNIDSELSISAAKISLRSSKSFGQSLIDDFAVENVVLGINAENTDNVLTVMGGILSLLSNGYLETTIRRAKAIDPNLYDGTFITAARLLVYVNRIETFLGIALSETL